MTATTVHPVRSITSAADTASLWRATVVATVLACITTEAWTAVIRGTGVRLAVNDPTGSAGSPIAFGACTIMVVLCMVPGAALAYAVRRWASRPARTWYHATAVLILLSFVPDLVEPSTAAGTRLTLMGAHVLAAAVVVPVIGRRLR